MESGSPNTFLLAMETPTAPIVKSAALWRSLTISFLLSAISYLLYARTRNIKWHHAVKNYPSVSAGIK